MRQKSTQTRDKKKAKKTVPIDLFPISSSSKPIASQFATAVQLIAYTFMDDAKLRRLGAPSAINPATGAPWIPKPRRGQYEITPTILGALAWWRAQATRPDTDHPIYVSMEDADTRGLIPREFQQYAQKKGLDFINTNRSVRSEPLRRYASEILRKIYSNGAPQLRDLDGLEDLDKDVMQARVLKQTEIEKIRDNALAEKILRTADDIESEIADPLAALSAGLNNYERQTGSKLRSLLHTLGIKDEDIQRVITVAAAGISEPRAKLQQAIDNAAALACQSAENEASK